MTVKCIDMDNNVTKTVTVDFAELGLTARRIQYEGFNAVEVSTSSGPYPGTRIIYRDDGILLFASIAGEQVKLAVEDDIAKKTAAQPTQPSTTTTASPITSTSTPSPTLTTTTHAPVTTAQTSTQPQTTTQPAATTPTTTPEKTQVANTMYVAVAAIAIVGAVVAAILLKKR